MAGCNQRPIGWIAEFEVKSCFREAHIRVPGSVLTHVQQPVCGLGQNRAGIIKTQLDFLISLFWLTMLFTVIWLSVLFYIRVSWFAFGLVGVIGAGLTAIWYKTAAQNYLAFADILRTSIDLFRFDLLAALHSKLPSSSEHERQIWVRLNQLIGYGENRHRIPYTHEGKS